MSESVRTSNSSQKQQFVESAGNTGNRTPTDWLTTGQAYEVAVARGLTLTPGSFSNAVATWRKTGKMPKSLKALGMQENFAPYKEHPLAKTNRWLRFE